MKIALLLSSLLLLTACSEDAGPPQASAPAQPADAVQAPAQPAATEQADLAAAEVAEGGSAAPDPCDLSGYDMTKMTADTHGEMEKACARSKQ